MSLGGAAGAATSKVEVLVVEDSGGYARAFLEKVLADSGHVYRPVSSVAEAARVLGSGGATRVFVDADLLKDHAAASVRRLAGSAEGACVIVFGRNLGVEDAALFFKSGAADVLVKPFDNLERVRSALRARPVGGGAVAPESEVPYSVSRRIGPVVLVGGGTKMRHLVEQIEKIGPLDVPVLITGESGTGKELVARALHERSGRSRGPFLAVNCGALPETLLESTLFGHEKGAFTGAVREARGYFEEATEGTLFLDEVQEMSGRMQASLLKIIEGQEYRRVGGVQALRSRSRLLYATNKDLPQCVAQKTFREDLYYRIDVIRIHVPPLRERLEDIPHLVDHFARRASEEMRVVRRVFSPEAIEILSGHDWPGNIRELENVVREVVALSPTQTVHPRQLQKLSGRARLGRVEALDGLPKRYTDAKRLFEEAYLRMLLEAGKKSVLQAAAASGLHPATLHRKILKYLK